MDEEAGWVQLLPETLRSLPADLTAVLLTVFVTDLVVVAPVLSETPLRVVVGLPFVLFLPGYALIAALFPEAGTAPSADQSDEPETKTDSGIDGIERVALSFGLSIAVTPLIGLVLNFTPWGIRLMPILASLTIFVVACTAVAAHRRRQLPPAERFRVPYRSWLARGKQELFHPDTRMDGALNVLLALSVILAVVSVGYAVAVPKSGESFTEFYLLTETEDGELVADGYPTNVTTDENISVITGIGNHEHQSVTYTTVVKLQNVSFPTNESNGTVTREAELRRFQVPLANNETSHRPITVQAPFAGERLRLAFLLYKGEPPADPTVENAYRETHLWLNVSAS